MTANEAYCPFAAATTLAFLAALSPMAPVRRAALSGFAIGAAFTVKQTAAFEGPLLFGMLLSASDARGRRAPTAAAFIGAASLVPLAFLAYFAAVGGAGNLIGDAVFRAVVRPASEQEGMTFLDGLQRFLGPHKSVLALTVLRRWRRCDGGNSRS